MGFKADAEFDKMTPEELKAYLKPCTVSFLVSLIMKSSLS